MSGAVPGEAGAVATGRTGGGFMADGSAATAPVPSYPALTGLRFFAAFSIVLWHSQTGYFFPANAFLPFMLAGAVPLFFVLSGFVLTVNAPKYRRKSDFLVARIARVWPGHMSALVFLFAIFWPYSLSLLHGAANLGRFAANVTLLQAWSPQMATYWSLNAPSWSVSVELCFYVLFPFLLPWLARRPARRMLALVGIAVGFILVIGKAFPHIDPLWLGDISPVINIPTFACGILAASVLRRLPASTAGFARSSAIELAALAFAIWGNAWFASVAGIGWPPGLAAFVQISGAVPGYTLLILALARYRGVVSWVLSLRLAVYLGEISYTIYLFHQLVIRAHSSYQSWHTGWRGQFAALPIWWQYAALLLGILVIAMASHHLIEQPARRGMVALWRRRRAAPVDPARSPAIVARITQGDHP